MTEKDITIIGIRTNLKKWLIQVKSARLNTNYDIMNLPDSKFDILLIDTEIAKEFILNYMIKTNLDLDLKTDMMGYTLTPISQILDYIWNNL